MTKLQDSKNSQLTARKAKDSTTSSLLTTIIGETEIIGKNERREVTDDTLKTLKRFEKGMIDTIGYMNDNGMSSTAPRFLHTLNELEIVRTFLPTKISAGQVLDAVKFIIGVCGLKLEQKSLGVITKKLKDKYGEQFDGKQAATQFKLLLS